MPLNGVERRRFEFLVVELSVAVGQLVPRYALWLELQERGCDPQRLSRQEALSFWDEGLSAFLAAHQLSLRPRARRSVRRRLSRFDPRHPTPYETMERLFSSRG